MIIFESLLTTFKVSNICLATLSSAEHGKSPKPNHRGQVKLVQFPDPHGRISYLVLTILTVIPNLGCSQSENLELDFGGKPWLTM